MRYVAIMVGLVGCGASSVDVAPGTYQTTRTVEQDTGTTGGPPSTFTLTTSMDGMLAVAADGLPYAYTGVIPGSGLTYHFDDYFAMAGDCEVLDVYRCIISHGDITITAPEPGEALIESCVHSQAGACSGVPQPEPPVCTPDPESESPDLALPCSIPALLDGKLTD